MSTNRMKQNRILMNYYANIWIRIEHDDGKLKKTHLFEMLYRRDNYNIKQFTYYRILNNSNNIIVS